MTNQLIIDIVGWIGSILLILAYLLISQNRVTSRDYSYQALNVVGSIFLVINTIYYGAFPSTAVNIVWVMIGTTFIIKISQNQKSS